MKNFIQKIRCKLKLISLVLLGVIILCTSVFAVINFGDNKNAYADEGVKQLVEFIFKLKTPLFIGWNCGI